MTWPLQVIHRRVRSLGLNPGWTLMTAVWVISLLGLVYATGRVRKGDWLSAIVEKMPIALAVMLLAFGLFLIFANVSATRSTSNVTRAAWWAARLSALHITLLLFPTIAIGLAMPPFGILFLPVYVLFGTHSGAVSGLLQAGHQILSLGFHKDLQPILHWLDAAIFCAALYYLVLRQDDDEAPSSTGRPRSTPGGSLAAPRASFGKRGG